DDCVVLPAIPELAADLDELLGNRAPLVCVERVLVAEIVGFSVGRSTRRVPGRAPSADKIQRGEYPGDIERFAIGRRHTDGETDVGGFWRQAREHRKRIQMPRQHGVWQSPHVVQEHEVQQTALGGLNQMTKVGDIERLRRPCDSPRMVAAASNGGAEDQVFIPCAHNRTTFPVLGTLAPHLSRWALLLSEAVRKLMSNKSIS